MVRLMSVTVRHGESLTLPWDRELRGPVGTTLTMVEPTAGQQATFEKMERVPGFDSVDRVLATIVREAIHLPSASQGRAVVGERLALNEACAGVAPTRDAERGACGGAARVRGEEW